MAQPQTIIGLNYGASFCSIAVVDKLGRPLCIADEDGSRQTAAAISWAGEEFYKGNQAVPQLVRNSKNTITRFRDLLGLNYSEAAASSRKTTSAPLVDAESNPAFIVDYNTAGSDVVKQKTVTAHDANVILMKSAVASGEDYLGKKVDAAVIAIPAGWSGKQKTALRAVAKEVGVNVLQLIPDFAAATAAYSVTVPGVDSKQDRNVVVVDVGDTSTTATVVTARQGLYSSLASVTKDKLGGCTVDEILVKHFAKEFSTKNKVPLDTTSTSPADLRALTKLRLACEQLKRTLSASSSGNIAVESLKDGIDFSSSMNRLKFNMLVSKSLYQEVANVVEQALSQTEYKPAHIDLIVPIGGTAALPGVIDQLASRFSEGVQFNTSIPSDEVVACGCALQAHHLATSMDPSAMEGIDSASVNTAPTTASCIVLVTEKDQGCILLLPNFTPLPARRTFEIEVPKQDCKVCLTISEGQESVVTEKIIVEDSENSDEDSEAEEEEVSNIVLSAGKQLEQIVLDSAAGANGLMTFELMISVEGKISVTKK